MQQEEQIESAAGQEREESLPVLAPRDALERLRTEGKLVKVCVTGLNLQGEFPKGLKFDHVRLVRLVVHRAVFKEFVDFHACRFVRPQFRESTFEKGVKFNGSTFRAAAFNRMTFHMNVKFDNSTFEGSSQFVDTTFHAARFWEAHVTGWFNFQRCCFHDTADLRSIHAEQGLVFTACHFEGDALFRGLSAAKKVDLTTSRCDALVDFSKAKLNDFVYLEQIEPGPNLQFAFANAIAERLLVSSKLLTGRMKSETDKQHDVAASEFGLLKRNFESLHRYDDEDWAFYRFKINQRKGRPTSWSRPWTKLLRLCDKVLLDWGCGYGTNPLRAVFSALVIIGLFGLLYAAEAKHFDITAPPFHWLPAEHWVNRLSLGFMTSVSVFTAGFSGDHLRSAHGWVLFPLACEALLGTLLWGLFIVAFSRRVIR